MNNKVVNKQIPIESIIKVADYLEDYKEKYDKKFELEENRNLPPIQRMSDPEKIEAMRRKMEEKRVGENDERQ